MVHLSNYDFIFGSIIIISAILAIIRGGVAELLSLSTWFIALFVMRNYASFLEKLIPDIITNGLLRSLISYIIAFFVVATAITLIKMVFHKFIHSFGLGGLNYMLGAIFGIARGIIISALIVILMEMFNLDENHAWQKSWLSPILKPTVTMIINAIPDRVKNINHEIGAEAEHIIRKEALQQGT